MTLCANNTPSTNEYTGNGAITEYSITFQYYSQSDIFVAFYDTATEAWVSVSNSNWSFLNPTVIKFNTAPADNQRILIYRCTDIDPLPAEFFPGTSIKAADLNNNFFVMKSAIEEINTQAGSSDTLAQSAKATADAANAKADTAIATANTASTNASSAVTTATTADTNATAAVNTANTALSSANTAVSTANSANSTSSAANTTANTADTKADTAIATANSASTAAGTAITDSQTALTSANSANTQASAAVTTANAADTKATTALNTANTADTNATTALSTSNTAYVAATTAFNTANAANTTANNADTKADTAIATANTADTNATTALNTANSVAGVANTADTNATTALNTANTALSTANTANTTANNANTTANNALNQVSAASPWSESSGVVSLVNSGSNVGVGTASTTARLTVNSNTATGNVNLADFIAPAANANALVRMIIRNAANNGTTSVDFYKQYQSGFGIHNTDTDPSNFTRFIVGASERMRITSGGNCGINTSTPSQKLEVAGNVSVIGGGNLLLQNGARVQYGGNDAASVIGQDGSNGYLLFGVGNERARITSSGNLGVNTSTPPARLTVTAGATSSTAYAGRSLNYGALVHTVSGRSGYIVQNTNAFTSANDNAGFQWLYPHNSGGDSNYKVFRSAVGTTLADKFWVNQGGGAYFANNVGIGTTSAARPLHISSNLNNPVRIQTSAGYSRIEFEASGTTNPANVSIGASGNDFRIFAGNNGGATRMIVKAGGSVGIAEENPESPLHISSSFNWNYPNLFLQRNASNISNHNYMIGFGLQADTASQANPASAAYIGLKTTTTPTAGDTLVSQNAKLEISSPGGIFMPTVVGIGNPNPGDYDSTANNLVVGQAGTGDRGITIASGTSHRGTLMFADGTSGLGEYAGYLQYHHNGNYLAIATNNSEAVRINSAGNLGVGESNPTSKLVVRGNAFFGPKNSSDQYQGASFQNGKDSGAGVTTTYLDFRNNLGIPDTHIFADHNTDGSSTIIFGATAAGARNSDRRSEKMRIFGNGRVAIGRTTADHNLDVEGFLRVSSGSAGLGLIQLGDDANPSDNFHIGSNSAGGFEIWNRNIGSGISMMSIDSNANMTVQGNLTVNGTINGTPGSGGGGGGAYKNVKTDFGAAGNGVNDDTTAVRNALNSGGTIYFPEGTYRITSTLYHTSAFNVVGDGQQSRIMFDAGVNDQNLFNLETNVRHNNDKKWSFSSIALSCKAVANRIHASGIRIAYTGAATVIGGTNYLELNDVHIVSEITTDATQAYFKYGLATVNIGGIVADNLNISSFNVNCENDTNTVGIYIQNNIEGHAVIRAFTGNNIYLQRYYKGLHATKIGGGQNIESIYMTQGEIVCNKGIDLAASHATFINGMHIECQRESYINTSDGGPHRVVGCDLRGGRNGTQNFTDYIIKIGVDNCSFTGNYITAQMPSAGCIKTGGGIGSPDNVSIVGNIFNGNGSSTYRALSCESGSANVIFTGNLGSGFGGNSNPVFNQIGTGQGKLNNTTNEFQ